MKQALLALLLICLLVAFGSPAQACAHGEDAGVVAISTQRSAPESAPAAPDHCPPASPAKLHACCVLTLVIPPEPAATATLWHPARFTPLGLNEPRPAPSSCLDKPPKSRA